MKTALKIFITFLLNICPLSASKRGQMLEAMMLKRKRIPSFVYKIKKSSSINGKLGEEAWECIEVTMYPFVGITTPRSTPIGTRKVQHSDGCFKEHCVFYPDGATRNTLVWQYGRRIAITAVDPTGKRSVIEYGYNDPTDNWNEGEGSY